MHETGSRTCTLFILVGLLAVLLPACGGGPDGSGASVPISTRSDQAREAYLKGRDLVEKLRVTDAREHYRRAVELDPEFALAHLGLANTSATANDFWQSLREAMSASAGATEGERLVILAADAGARGALAEQEQHLTQLAGAFPEDARVQNLLGQYYFGRQDWAGAVEHYEKATAIDPDFSQPYNQLGYAQRFLGNHEQAEAAFRKYIARIPDEPNPYDSYAELLMKLGRFEESIENYEKALDQDPNFIASYIGIGNDRIFMGEGEAAREAFAKLGEIARNDAERRQALFWTAASYLHEGRTDEALEALEARYAVAQESDDLPAMAFDLTQIGNVLLEAGRPDEAMARYVEGLGLIERADVPGDNKENFRRNHLFRAARVALASGNVAEATELAAAFGERVAEHGIPFEVRQHHWLQAMIAMANDDPDGALRHLDQANRQDPRVLWDMVLAHDAAGHHAEARAVAEQVADFNQLNFNYAFVRNAARARVSEG